MNCCDGVSAVVLAGGASTRMGQDKALLGWDGKTLLQRQLELLRSTGIEEVFVSVRPGVDYGSLGCSVVEDAFAHCGPLAGVERGLAHACHSLVLVVAVDLPLLKPDFVKRLLSQCEAERGVVPMRRGGHWEPLVAVYPKPCHRLALELLLAGRCAMWMFVEGCIAARAVRPWRIPSRDEICFYNCNAAEDWQALFVSKDAEPDHR